MWALSMKRERVCRLQLLLVSPAQSFPGPGPGPMGLATIFYCLRFETSLFIVSYDSQSCDGSIEPASTRDELTVIVGFSLYSLGSDHGTENIRSLAMNIAVPRGEHLLRHWFYRKLSDCCMRFRLPGNVFTESFPSNGSACHNMFSVYTLCNERTNEPFSVLIYVNRLNYTSILHATYKP
jgi:hypothetical protein